MKKISLLLAMTLIISSSAAAQSESQQPEDAVSTPKIISLEQALQIAISENPSVKVADMEIERTGYARKGSYAALFPTIDGSAAYQRTIKKQVMYMDFDMSAMGGGAAPGQGSGAGSGSGSGANTGSGSAGQAKAPAAGGGIEVGRWNTWSTGISAAMPLVNAQL